MLRIEVGRGLVDKVDVSRLAKRHSDGHTLKLTTRKGCDLIGAKGRNCLAGETNEMVI